MDTEENRKCSNCKWGKPWEENLGFGDVADTKMDTILTEVFCQKKNERKEPDYYCDDWESKNQESQQSKS